MKKQIVLALLSLALTSSPAFAVKEGGGGGGIYRSGQYLTFGSAGLHVGLTPLMAVPGLDLLTQTFLNLPINDHFKGILVNTVFNMGARKYYAISDTDLTADKRQELVKAYQATLGNQVTTSELVVYAYTDAAAGETYLLPEFFKLHTNIEQSAVLFHEGIWAYKGNSVTYNFVVDSEIKFQNYLEAGAKGYDPDFFPVLDELLGNNLISLRAAFADDLSSGAIQGILAQNQPKISLYDLVGKEQEIVSPTKPKSTFSPDAIDRGVMFLQLMKDTSQYPKSYGLRRLYELRNTLRFSGWSSFSGDMVGSVPYLDLSNITQDLDARGIAIIDSGDGHYLGSMNSIPQ